MYNIIAIATYVLSTLFLAAASPSYKLNGLIFARNNFLIDQRIDDQWKMGGRGRWSGREWIMHGGGKTMKCLARLYSHIAQYLHNYIASGLKAAAMNKSFSFCYSCYIGIGRQAIYCSLPASLQTLYVCS